jgi:hypothetical protein
MTTIAQLEPSGVTVGVDTHGEVHVACALDQLGRHLATLEVATTLRGSLDEYRCCDPEPWVMAPR